MIKRPTYKTWRRSRGHRLPQGAYLPNLPVHVILTTQDREPTFQDDRIAEAVYRILQAWPGLLALCLMPEHPHWLLVARDLITEVKRFKSFSTKEAWRYGHSGRLWQRSFFDHVLRSTEGGRKVAEYIVANPVRRGLVSSPAEYPFSHLVEDAFPAE